MFRKNSQPEFNCSVKNGEHTNLNLIENQIVLDIDINIKNGFTLKVGNYYIPLSSEQTAFTLKIPIIERGDKIQLKVLGFFKQVKVNIPLERKGVYANRPLLSQEKLITNVKVKQKKFEIDLNARIDLPQMQVASNINKPKLLEGTRSSIPSVRLHPVAEPSFNYEIEKLKLKLNQEL